ncbi:hypothetical protein DSO57_1036627 [Entomophthora muscae]|uniref:Uncharacterized protein n=1 Tax=Entomophthora muscae TaxID=34485 RepID=A0ACC2TAL9_9FUNG|nr:hypothetical protein DSO57_1036627 [Entomophthora muscae]
MSAVYTTSRYRLETIGQEADESTLLEFYQLDTLEASAWSDIVIAPTSPTNLALNLPRKEEGMKDPLGINVNNSEMVDDSDNASMLSYTGKDRFFYLI